MRKHSDSFPLWLVGAAAALTYIFSTFYQDALKASVLKYLTEWFGPAAANMLSGLTEIAPAVGAAILIVWLLYRYMDREFQRELSETLRSTQQLLATNQETSPLVRAMLEEKVSSQIEVMKRQREIAKVKRGQRFQRFSTSDAIAKMRVFRVPAFLGAALMLGLLATLLLFVSRSL